MDQTLQQFVDDLKAIADKYGGDRLMTTMQLPNGECLMIGWARTWEDATNEDEED